MNIAACPVLLLFACSLSFEANAQAGGGYLIGQNNAAVPCVTVDQYRVIEQQCAANIQSLGLAGNAQKKTASTLFSWPLKAATNLTDCGFYGISAYVDQDTSTGIKDFNCGTTTYDGHKGTDIFVWPFPFYKMDHDQVEIIAAAPGTIVNKVDGNFDKNCAANSLTANYVVIQHADGSMALYLHMKSGSLTTKTIGQSVVVGEFLGRVGSSGSSTGPHLHFEVWSGSTVATRKDPFSGTCNTLNSSTWWAAQKAYKNPAIIKASVHSAVPVLPPCPATETPNEDSCFMPGTATAVFAIFLRDETTGMTANMSILNSAGTVISSWIHNSTINANGSYWYWTKSLPATPGAYTFKAVYNGITCAKNFKIDCSFTTAVTNPMSGQPRLQVTPNPAGNTLNMFGAGMENGLYRFALKNVLGQLVYTDDAIVSDKTFQKTWSISALPGGIYFLIVESGTSRTVSQIVKQ